MKFQNGRKILTLLTVGCPGYKAFVIVNMHLGTFLGSWSYRRQY